MTLVEGLADRRRDEGPPTKSRRAFALCGAQSAGFLKIDCLLNVARPGPTKHTWVRAGAGNPKCGSIKGTNQLLR